MAVRVVRAHRDQRQPCAYAPQQTGVLMGRAVVGDLEDIDGRERREGSQQPPLGRWFEVPQEQQGRAALDPYEQRHAGVIGPLRYEARPRKARPGRRGCPGCTGCRRPQHLPGKPPDPPPLPRPRPDHGHPGRSRRPPHKHALLPGLVVRRRLNRTDGSAPQHTWQPPDMIGMEVRQKDQRNPGDSQVAQATVGQLRIGPRVHDDGRTPARRKHGGVPLPDIAHRERPPRWRPAGHGSGERGRTQHGEQKQQRAACRPPGMPGKAPGGEHDQDRDDSQQQPARPAVRPPHLSPGQRRPGARDGGDPPRGPPGTTGHRLGNRHRHRRRGESGEPENRGRGDRELGDEIAGDRHQADPGREDRHDGSAYRLCGSRRTQRLGEPGRHPYALQRRAPAGADGEQRARGQNGEQKAVTPREPRVVQDQQQCGGGQRRQQRPAASGADGEQGDGPAGRGPQHARFRSAHDDESEREPTAEECGPSQRDAQPGRETSPFGQQRGARRSDQQYEHDGEIAARYGKQMREIRCLEGILEVGRDPRGVAHDQPREQSAGIRGEPLGRSAQSRPEPSGRALKGGRRSRDRRRTGPVRPQDRSESVVGVQRRREPSRQPERGGGQQSQPPGCGVARLAGRTCPHDHQHGRPGHGHSAAWPRHSAHLRVQHHGTSGHLIAADPGPGQSRI